MSWLGGSLSLSSIKGQISSGVSNISNLTKEVLSEVVSPSEDEEEAALSKKKIEELKQRLVQQEHLARQWEQRALAAESQISLIKIPSGQPSSCSGKEYEFPSGTSSNNEESSQENDGDFVNIPLAAASSEIHEDADDLAVSSDSQIQVRDRIWRKCRYLLAEVDLHLPPQWGPLLLTEKEQTLAAPLSVPVSAAVAENTASSLTKVHHKHQMADLQEELEKIQDLLQTATTERDNLMTSLDELDQQHQLAIEEALKSRTLLQQQVHELQSQLSVLLSKSDPNSDLQDKLKHALEENQGLKDDMDRLLSQSKVTISQELAKTQRAFDEAFAQEQAAWTAEKMVLVQSLEASSTKLEQAEKQIEELNKSLGDLSRAKQNELQQWNDERHSVWQLLNSVEESESLFDFANTENVLNWLRSILKTYRDLKQREAKLQVQLDECFSDKVQVETECSETKEKLQKLLNEFTARNLVSTQTTSELEPIYEELEEVDDVIVPATPQQLLLRTLNDLPAPPISQEDEADKVDLVSQLEKKIESLEEQLWDREREIKRKQEAVETLRDELNQAKVVLEGVETKLQTVEETSLKLACSIAALSNKEKSQEDLMHQLAEKDCVIHELELRLLTTGSQSADEECRTRNVEKAHAKLIQQLETLQSSKLHVEEQLTSWQNRHAELIQQIESSNVSYATMQMEYHSLREELAKKSKHSSELALEVQKLSETRALQDLEAELTEFRSKWQDCETVCKRQEESIQNLSLLLAEESKRSETLGKENSEMVRKYSELQTTKQELEECITTLQNQHAELMEQIEIANTAQTTLTAEKEKLKEELVQGLRLCSELKSEVETLTQTTPDAKVTEQLENEVSELREKLHTSRIEMQQVLESALKERDSLLERYRLMEAKLDQERTEVEEVRTHVSASTEELVRLRQEKDHLLASLQVFQSDREQLVTAVQQKHQESLAYHAEVQRLIALMQEKHTDEETVMALQEQLTKAQDKCDALQQHSVMLEGERSKAEQELEEARHQLQTVKIELEANFSKVQRLETEVTRLTEHLVSVEESYTHEALKTEQRTAELKQKLDKAEDQLRKRQTALSGASQRAVLQADALQEQVHQLKLKLSEEEAFRRKAQEETRQHVQSLANLQLVLEQFQKEKERDLGAAALEWKRKVFVVEKREDQLKQEVQALHAKFSEAQVGLEAAARLTQQFDAKSAQLSALRDEVKQKESELERMRKEKDDLSANQGGKVDRFLVKNLVVGYFMAPPAKRTEVLRIIATVLDFSGEERAKTGADASTATTLGWGAALLRGAANRIRQPSQSTNSSAENLEKSLSEAFIRFLQAESQPQVTPKLPAEQMASSTLQKEVQQSNTGHSSVHPMAPSLEMELVPSRNAPTILRDVLQDRTKAVKGVVNTKLHPEASFLIQYISGLGATVPELAIETYSSKRFEKTPEMKRWKTPEMIPSSTTLIPNLHPPNRNRSKSPKSPVSQCSV